MGNEAAIAQHFDSIFFDSSRLGEMQPTVTRRDGSWYRSKTKSNDPCHNPPLVITVEDSCANTTRSTGVVFLVRHGTLYNHLIFITIYTSSKTPRPNQYKLIGAQEY